ncbi:MAG: TRAP transporter small permease [Desulfuromonadaceae bacterium]|nr:TRAP transporter small permease [Desulfuromonadaceae bacterium]
MASESTQGLLSRLRRIGVMIEDTLLILFLSLMILLACGQIVLRNFFSIGLVWADGLLQISVLWLGLLGAMAASRDDNHINIDVLTRFCPEGLRVPIRLLSYLFTAVVCGILAWQSFQFVQSEYTFGTTGVGKYPIWIFQSILPIAFGLISYRYVLNFFVLLRGTRREEKDNQ